jgi:hypothetical protein
MSTGGGKMKTHFADDETLKHIARLEADVQELRAALQEAINPLDLYNAYGWPDRNGIRNKARATLARTEPKE